MSIEVSIETEARISEEVRRQCVSVDALLNGLISERGAAHVFTADGSAAPQVPILHPGRMGALRRRDIYDDAR